MALELGAARCLRKPFTPEALLAVVNECLAEARSRFSGCRPVELEARGYSAAGGRLFDAPMRRSQSSAIGVVAVPGPGACIGKTLFTINDIDERFLGLSYSYGSAR